MGRRQNDAWIGQGPLPHRVYVGPCLSLSLLESLSLVIISSTMPKVATQTLPEKPPPPGRAFSSTSRRGTRHKTHGSFLIPLAFLHFFLSSPSRYPPIRLHYPVTFLIFCHQHHVLSSCHP